MQGPARQTEEGIPSVVVLVNDEACSQGSKDEADGSGHGVAEGRCDQARARRQQSQNCVDADVTILARGDEGAEKAGPEHEMTDQRIPPQPRDAEEVSQQDLGKGQDQKGTDEHDENALFETVEEGAEEELAAFEARLIDRFGELPKQAEDLLNSVRIKWIATHYGLEKVVMKNKKLIGFFIADQQSKFYQSPAFSRVLQFVQTHSNKVTLKEKKTSKGLRLLLTAAGVSSVEKALDILRPLMPKKVEQVSE